MRTVLLLLLVLPGLAPDDLEAKDLQSGIALSEPDVIRALDSHPTSNTR